MKLSQSDIALSASLLGLMPLLAVQAAHLWERPHFQFFPIAWLALVVLVVKRAGVDGPGALWRRRAGVAAWGAGLLCGVLAAFLFSPWLGEVAAILCVTGWGLLRLRAVPLARWLGWTCLLWVTVPLPGSLDRRLVGGLQTLSSESASSLLDLIGLAHLRQGNLIEIRSGKLFVDEACSGIDSLYSLAAIGLIMVLWQKRPLVVGLLTLASVPLWAWFGNVLRLFVIVWFLDRWQIDLSHGWKHTLLGFIVFAMSSGCLFLMLDAADQLFKRFSKSAMPRDNKRWHQWYNAVVCFPGRPPQLKTEEEQYFTTSKLYVEEPNSGGPAVGSVPTRAFGWSKSLVAGVVVASLFVSSLSVWAIVRRGDGFTLPHYEAEQVDAAFTEAGMPERLLGAERVSFHKEHRSHNSFDGEHSRIWRYRHGRSEFLLSADFPFRGFHPLWVCYTNAGHTLEGQRQAMQLPTTDGPAAGEPTVGFGKLKDDLGSTSYLWFSLFDASGQPISMQVDNGDGPNMLAERLFRNERVMAEPITYQFQLYVQSGADLPQEELDRYLQVFATALPHAVEQVKQLDAVQR